MTANGFQIEERVSLMRDGLLQNLALVASGLIGLMIVPLLLRGLGARAYGLWLAAMSVAAVVATLDLGLGMSVTREVASAENDEDAALFVVSAGHVHLLLGLAGGLLVFAAGFVMRSGLNLDAEGIRQTPWVFGLTGACLVFDVASLYAGSVLAGLRRFGVASGIAVGNAISRAAGLAILLHVRGADVVALAGWQAFISLLFSLVGFWTVARLAPRFRFRIGLFDWPSVRSRARFALASQIGGAAGQSLWRIPSILAGLLCGSSLVTTLSVAQRLPLAVELVLWKISDVLMPAISARKHDRSIVAEILAVGLRWTLLIALPFCVALWFLAGPFLNAWLGNASAESILVFRLTALAVLIESAGHAAEIALWGSGLARGAAAVTVGRAVFLTMFCAWVLPGFGASGAAYVALAAVSLGTLVCLRLAASHLGLRSVALLAGAARGLTLPLLLGGFVAWSFSRWPAASGWLGLGCASISTGVAYGFFLSLGSLREEEKTLAREILRLPFMLFKARDRPNPSSPKIS